MDERIGRITEKKAEATLGGSMLVRLIQLAERIKQTVLGFKEVLNGRH